MMKKLFVAVLTMLAVDQMQAQYYFKDIVSTKQLTDDMLAYKRKKVRTVKIKSFEADGSASEGFFCEKRISRDFRTSELYTKTSIASRSLFTAYFDDHYRITSSMDSSEISRTETTYDYDAAGRIIKIKSSITSSDDDFTNEIIEEHIYAYNEAGLLKSMMRVKNMHDSTMILFSEDEKNNVAIEKDSKTGRKFYYYYDDKNRLTDIAHSNEFREKMVADYIFEYDADGMLKQMTVTEEGRGKEQKDNAQSFVIWRYMNEDGLRTREGLFSEKGKLIGSVEYEYK